MAGLIPGTHADHISPNGEMLGGVLLLGFWALLIYKDQIRNWFPYCVALGVTTFHLKYQLVPQLALFTLCGGIGFRKSIQLLGWIAITSLMTNLATFPFSDANIFSRLLSFRKDYGAGFSLPFVATDVTGKLRLVALAWLPLISIISLSWASWLLPLLSGRLRRLQA